MRIVVDSRERHLFDELKYNPPKTVREYTENAASRMCGIHLDDDYDNNNNNNNIDTPVTASDLITTQTIVTATCKHEKHTLEKKRLVIGDIALRTSSLESDIILFERKTLNDLASSIQDGRYKEQSFRINQHCSLSNHNVIYIIEGDMTKYAADRLKPKSHNPITKKTLYSAMFSMWYMKGFSIFRTTCIRETADLILYFADKYEATSVQDRVPHYSDKHVLNNVDQTNESIVSDANDSYSSVFKHKERSSQITPDNIGEIMISAIPFVSSKTASAIMHEYKTMDNLMSAMKKDRLCLNHITLTTPSGTRKISKLCVDNLFKYLIG